jgi:hypothetical protein
VDGDWLVLVNWDIANASAEEMERRREKTREDAARRNREYRARQGATPRQPARASRFRPEQAAALERTWGMSDAEIAAVEDEWFAAATAGGEGTQRSLGGQKTSTVTPTYERVTRLLNTEGATAAPNLSPSPMSCPGFGVAHAPCPPPAGVVVAAPAACSEASRVVSPSPPAAAPAARSDAEIEESPWLRWLDAPALEEPAPPEQAAAPAPATQAPPPKRAPVRAPRRTMTPAARQLLRQVRELHRTHEHRLGGEVNLGAIANTLAPYGVIREAFDIAAENVRSPRKGCRVESPGRYIMGLIRRRVA